MTCSRDGLMGWGDMQGELWPLDRTRWRGEISTAGPRVLPAGRRRACLESKRRKKKSSECLCLTRHGSRQLLRPMAVVVFKKLECITRKTRRCIRGAVVTCFSFLFCIFMSLFGHVSGRVICFALSDVSRRWTIHFFLSCPCGVIVLRRMENFCRP